MNKQLIVTIGREYGSAGHIIAEKLARKLEITLYDRKFIENSYELIGYSREILEKFDEKPVNVWFSKKIGNHSNSIESHVQQRIFDFIKDKADMGESFVIVGRCADQLLRKNSNTVRVFILGDIEEKISHVMEVYNLPRNKALAKIKRHDKKRKAYHNTYSDIKWGDSRGYHLCINSSLLGIDDTVEMLYDYVIRFMNVKKTH